MSDFICPVKNARLTSKFGHRTINGKKEWHQGVDLASTGKVAIYAAADGEVIRSGPLSTYGNVVMIRHTINGKRMDTNYAHLDSYNVKVGQKVKQGQPIGIMGNTGRSFGIHLHFEIHNGAWATGQPNAVDPMKYISLTEREEELTLSQYQQLQSQINELTAEVKTLRAQLGKKADKQSSEGVSSWAKESWDWAKDGKNFITDGSNPVGALTREQSVAMLKRYHDKFHK